MLLYEGIPTHETFRFSEVQVCHYICERALLHAGVGEGSWEEVRVFFLPSGGQMWAHVRVHGGTVRCRKQHSIGSKRMRRCIGMVNYSFIVEFDGVVGGDAVNSDFW